MEKMQTILLLFVIGMTGTVLLSPCGAADTTAPLAVAGDSLSAAGCPKCSCSCSPWLGAWVGCFTEDGKDDAVSNRNACEHKMIETFKFSLKSLTCDQFVLNLQASLCEEKVRKAFPEADRVTEFVGVACKNDYNKVVFTAIGYGVKTRDKICDEVVFIAVKSGTISCPCDTDPNVVDVTETIEIFAAEQDTNCDGLPDECDSVICISRTGQLKRVLNRPPCEPARSFVALLEPCKDCETEATGKAFFKKIEGDDKLSFVVTVKDIKDVTKVAIHVSDVHKEVWDEAVDAEITVILCPKPPETSECKSGDFSGLLCCGTIVDKDCAGPLKGKKVDDLIKAIEEGRAKVVIHTRKYPKGELCGRIEDP